MITAQECMKYLRQFGYKTTEQGVQKVLDKWLENKSPLLDKFRLDPNWDEDALAIVYKNVEFPKQFSPKPLHEFAEWTQGIIPKYEMTKAIEDKSEVYYINKLDDIRAMVRYANKNNKKVEIEGKDVLEIQSEAQQEYDDYNTRNANNIKIKEDDEKSYFLTREFKENIDKVYDAIFYIANFVTDSTINAEQATEINRRYNVNATENQKLSRVINKLCTAIGINEYRETQTTTNNEGEEITREVGYQHKFNIMAEAVTSRTYKVHAVLSLNPLDFWGMSIIHKASSCMTIDCLNIGNRTSAFSGQASGGTTSFMLDKCSVIFYTVIEDYAGNKYYSQEKMNRCTFSISDNGTMIMQHRVYPDARDGGDSNKAKQYREIVQDVVSRLWNNKNLWTLKKGYDVRSWYSKEGIQYDDLCCNDDVTLSLLKNHDDETPVDSSEYTKLKIGYRNVICPVCGREHDNNRNILCYDCRSDYYSRDYAIENALSIEGDIDSARIPHYADFSSSVVTENNNTEEMVECANCGETILRDSAIEINGEYYCDEECASESGYHYIEEIDEYRNEESDIDEDYSTEEWHLTENGFYDDYDGHFYYGEPEVIAEDESEFFSTENAISANYDSDEHGVWYPTDEMIWNDRIGFRHIDNCIEINGDYFIDEEDARNNGYVETLNDEWENASDCFYDDYYEGYCRCDDSEAIEIDGRYYADEDSAINAGYRNVNGEWFAEDEVLYDEYTDNLFTASNAQVVTEDGKYFYCETSAIMAGYRETENGWILVESERESA